MGYFHLHTHTSYGSSYGWLLNKLIGSIRIGRALRRFLAYWRGGVISGEGGIRSVGVGDFGGGIFECITVRGGTTVNIGSLACTAKSASIWEFGNNTPNHYH